MNMDDPTAQLRAQARAGDADAFGAVFDACAKSVYNHAFRLTGDWSAAEEIMAMTFLEAWRGRDRIAADGGSLRPWLLGIATNLARGQHRTARRHRTALARLAVARRRRGMSLAAAYDKAYIDSWVWGDATDALEAGAGNPQVRAGVLRLLSTVSGVVVTQGTLDGQPTLVVGDVTPGLNGNGTSEGRDDAQRQHRGPAQIHRWRRREDSGIHDHLHGLPGYGRRHRRGQVLVNRVDLAAEVCRGRARNPPSVREKILLHLPNGRWRFYRRADRAGTGPFRHPVPG